MLNECTPHPPKTVKTTTAENASDYESEFASPPRRILSSTLTVLMLACFAVSGWLWLQPSMKPQEAQAVAVAAPQTRLASTLPRASNELLSIEDVRLGRRVVGRNPLREQTQLPSDIHPETHRAVRLQMNQHGTMYELAFVRSLTWLDEQDAQVGGTIHLLMPEMGLDGPARVISIDPCPEIEPDDGTGRMVVTGTMKHLASNVLEIQIAGEAEPLGVTDTHPIWSEDRQDFVVAGQLKVGESLQQADGMITQITHITPTRGPPVMVYNLEIDGEHVFHVGEDGVLVHNDCLPSKQLDSRNAALREAKRDLGIPQSQVPTSVTSVPMTDKFGNKILGADGKPIMTREFRYTTPDGRTVVIQDHSAGHPQFDIGPHMNVRPVDEFGNTIRNGTVPGTAGHYGF